MHPDEPIEHELLRNAVAAEVSVTSTEVRPTSTGDTVTSTEVSPTSTGDRHLGLLRAAPPVPAPLVPRNATEVGERRCGRDTEARRAPA